MTNIEKHEIRRFWMFGKIIQVQHQTWCDMFTINFMATPNKCKIISREIAARLLVRK